MTITGSEPGGQTEENTVGDELYHISLFRLDQLNRSAVHLIAGRLTQECPSYGTPTHGANPGDLIREIQEFHSGADDFIRYDMPIKEIAFRTLLTRGNEPMTLSALHRELTGHWSNALRPISIEVSLLGRVLESDTYYGFARA